MKISGRFHDSVKNIPLYHDASGAIDAYSNLLEYRKYLFATRIREGRFTNWFQSAYHEMYTRQSQQAGQGAKMKVLVIGGHWTHRPVCTRRVVETRV